MNRKKVLRKTKIICTMGPANDDPSILKKLMLEGMNAARFNFSHADHQSHKKKLDLVKKLRAELHLPVATILDTKGPEIRIGHFKEGKVELHAGDFFTLTTNEVEGDNSIVSITYKDLPNDIQTGATVLIDDGLIEMTVVNVTKTDITCSAAGCRKAPDRSRNIGRRPAGRSHRRRRPATLGRAAVFAGCRPKIERIRRLFAGCAATLQYARWPGSRFSIFHFQLPISDSPPIFVSSASVKAPRPGRRGRYVSLSL